jgi:hypothetical protein
MNRKDFRTTSMSLSVGDRIVSTDDLKILWRGLFTRAALSRRSASKQLAPQPANLFINK